MVQSYLNNDENEEEIDLKDFLLIIKRFTKVVLSLTLLGLLTGALFGNLKKNIWRGEFQIVLEKNSDKNPLSNISGNIPTISFLQPNKNKLRTDIEILQSPSILINIFEFVKKEKISSNEKTAKNLRFKKWRNDYLTFNLEPETSVLKISYEDTNKELILPVLNKISKSYQDYSGSKKKRNIELSEKYYLQQINLFKNLSRISKKNLDNFGNLNSLFVVKTQTLNSDKMEGNNISLINVEAIKNKAYIKLNELKIRISDLSKIENQPSKIIAFAGAALENSDILIEIRNLQKEIGLKKIIYRDNDDIIVNLKKQEASLVSVLKKEIIADMKAKITINESLLKSAERPEGVLLKYKELLRESLKDQITIEKLENQYRIVMLEKAKNEDPWSLITNPTLIPFPIAPIKNNYLILGAFSGFFIGISLAFTINKIKDLIHTTKDIEKISNSEIIGVLSFDNNKYLEAILKNFLINYKGNICFYVLGANENNMINQINIFLKKISNQSKILVTDNFNEVEKSSMILLIPILGKTTRKDLLDVLKSLSLLKIKIIGFLPLNNYGVNR